MDATELKYVIDAKASEPIILIHGDIGYSEGTMGDQFTKELMYLDSLGKKRIQVWINSGGGVVTDGEQICNAILKSITPVDTYNTGTCASIAYPIFACGRKRIMMDWAKNMFHNPFGGDESALEAFKKTILKIIIQRSNGKLTEQYMSSIMDRETWIMAEESLELGLCDEIEDSSAYNKAEVIKNLDSKLTPRLTFAKVLNQMFEEKNLTIQNMKSVYNKLGLIDGSTEDKVSAAIDAIRNEASFNKSEYEKCKKELEAKVQEYIETKAKFDALQAKFDAAQAKISDAENSAKTVKAEALVNANVKLGKVANTPEAIKNMVELAVKDFEGTEKMLNSLASTVKGADFSGVGKTERTFNAMDVNNSVMDAYNKRKGIVK